MNLLQLEYFHELVRTENETQAAKNLHVAQSALSTMLRKLEKELGCELFDREGKTIRLNENGKKFYCNTSTILDIIARNKTCQTGRSSEKKELRVGFRFTETPFLNYLGEFSARNSTIQVTILSAQSIVAVESQSSLDFMFSKKLKDIHNCKYLELDLPTIPYCYLLLPVHHPLSNRKKLTPKDLSGYLSLTADTKPEQVLSFVQVLPTRTSMPAEYLAFRDLGITPRVPVVTDDRFTMMTLVANAGLASIVPFGDYPTLRLLDGVVGVPLYLNSHYNSHYNMGWHESSSLSPQRKAFLEYIMEKFHLDWCDVKWNGSY